ncbi:MAM and LDL-receptor class A domain-containing protein 2-like [Antedon mediterranea]|uniref:MAM and LDL-receptor class A domain-containing protein 2-like n=1 Tax=Antedon mediterranea TaxID=105859 RepID=UPI003AF48950
MFFFIVLPSGATPPGIPIVTPTPGPTFAPPTFYTSPVDCDFDTDICAWTQVQTDVFDWTRARGNTASDSTGPRFDHTTGKGYYMYIETSSPRLPGENAQLSSLSIASGSKCFRFWYHMYGQHVDTLNVYIQAGPSLPSPTWSKTGAQGDIWLEGQVTISTSSSYLIVIEGIRGSNFYGDIAIDDLLLLDGTCPPIVATLAPTALPFSVTCDFESELLCGFRQSAGDDFDWTRGYGATTSTDTGPANDHTYGTGYGHYMYIETSTPRTNGDVAQLYSPTYKARAGSVCLEFWYHMYGPNIGSLNIYQQKNGIVSSVLWSKSSNEGIIWNIDQLSLTADADFQVVFEGITGNGARGDIAIDDVTIREGACPNSGSCDFEDGMCTWGNVNGYSADTIEWIEGSGSTDTIYTGPSVDHTFGANGTYLFVDATGRYPGDRAYLMSKSFDATTTDTCFHFWYHMYGISAGKLIVELDYWDGQVFQSETKWEIHSNQGDQWLMAQVKIESSFQHKIVIIAEVGNGNAGDIAIDDLVLDGASPCAVIPQIAAPVTPAPPVTVKTTVNAGTVAPSLIDCDFELGICGYTQLKTDDFDWTRQKGSTASSQTGPSTDHTTGIGYYIYIETSSPRLLGDKALISTPSMTITSKRCLNFWYHMYGSTVDTLNVYFQKFGQLGTPIWTKSQTQGDQWLEALVDVPDGGFEEVVFEGIRGSSYFGDIALDDIVLLDGDCNSNTGPPAIGNSDCTFEDTAMCGWSNIAGDNFNWIRQTGSTSSTSTGPQNDHTYGTNKGYYVYIETSSPRVKGDNALLQSLLNAQTTSECLEFYYHMYGTSIGTLNLFYKTASGGMGTPVWSLSTDQGNSWRGARVNVFTTEDFQIVFEGIVGSSYTGDIAVDDVKLLGYSCPDPSHCDFESGFCAWSNDVADDFDWIKGTGSTSSIGTGPATDHTTATDKGSYMYIDASSTVENSTARLNSELIPATASNGRCFHFWYHMYGVDIGKLQVVLTDGKTETLLWDLSNNQGNQWWDASIGVHYANQFRMVFVAVRGSGYSGDIAIDDVTFTVGVCGGHPSNAVQPGFTTLAPTQGSTIKPVPTPPPGPVDCDFESGGICNTWTQANDDDFDWTFGTGSTATIDTGPAFDHTLGTAAGHYIYIEASSPRIANDTARIVSTAFYSQNATQHGDVVCLQFWYHMYGTHVNRLNIHQKVSGVLTDPIWSMVGEQGNLWKIGQVNLKSTQNFKIVFEGLRGLDYRGDISIDDISTYEGYCAVPYADYCDFEEPVICGYLQDTTDDFDWTRRKGSTPSQNTGPSTDHSYKTGEGYYMYVESSTPRLSNEVARLISNVHQPTNGQCLHDIAIDDVSLTDGDCPRAGDCNFETDLCIWENDYISDDFDWLIGSGETDSLYTGPTTDHTLGTSKGHYMFIETSSPRVTGDRAVLSSQVFPPIQSRCINFWYHMYGTSVGTLNLYIVNPYTNVKRNIWTISGDKGDRWYLGSTDFSNFDSDYLTRYGASFCYIYWNTNKLTFVTRYLMCIMLFFQVVFEAIRGSDYTGDIAIDDIQFTAYTSCAVNPADSVPPTTSPPTVQTTVSPPTQSPPGNYDCDFELDFCLWTQAIDDQFDWRRGRGVTTSPATGPLTDHTLETNLGYYVYIEVTPQNDQDKARLEGPPFSGGEKCLRFWHHMFGQHIDSLNVYIKNGGTLGPARWTKSGGQIDDWFYGEVSLPASPSNYQVVFEGIANGRDRGDIALDDISFIEEPCKLPTDWTTCGFESSDICGFAQDGTDDFDWQHVSKGTDSIGTGPDFDHTYGTAFGMYVYIETSSPRRPSDKSRLISTQRSRATECWQFWFHMYGSNAGTLNVYVKDSSTLDFPVWMRSGDQGNQWLIAQVTVSPLAAYQIHIYVVVHLTLANSIQKTFIFFQKTISKIYFHVSQILFQLVFEGVVGVSFDSDIALDDLTVTQGACPEAGECNFENGFCTWTNLAQNDDFDWLLGQGKTPSGFSGPSTDQTLGTDAGTYVFLDSSANQQNDVGVLYSIQFDPTSSSSRCMNFWYHMYGSGVASLSIGLYVGPDPTAITRSLWILSGDQGNQWQFGAFSFKSSVTYKLAITAIQGTLGVGDIALDDITFSSGVCSISPSNAIGAPVTAAPSSASAGPTTPYVPSAWDCTFDQGFCTWTQASDDQFDWMRATGPTGTDLTGPHGDHTSGSGWYSYIETSSPRMPNDAARLESSIIPVDDGHCLRFWYHMYGTHVKILNVYTKIGVSLGDVVWVREGTNLNKWIYAEINLKPSSNFRIVFEGVRGTDNRGDIAIDDVTVKVGICLPPQGEYCDFELAGHDCGFTQDTADDFNWRQITGTSGTPGTGPSVDHTLGTKYGGYYFTDASAPRKLGDKARLISETRQASTGSCAEFYYNMNGADMGTLNVYVQPSGITGQKQLLWTLSGDQGDVWHTAQVTATYSSNFQIVWEGVIGTGSKGDIAIDDISVRDGACSPPGDCNFENGLCTWMNTANGDDFDWLSGQGVDAGKLTGPIDDHTRGDDQGYYMFIEMSNPRIPGDKAWLVSQNLQSPGVSGKCMEFWFHLYGSNMGTLSVYVDAGSGKVLLWQLYSDFGNSWVSAQLPITSLNTFVVYFEAVRGSNHLGDMAIDDITFATGSCSVQPPSADPNVGPTAPPVTARPTTARPIVTLTTPIPTQWNCNFEFDLCSWSQATDDEFDWTRAQGPTSTTSSGPINDHTKGTSAGYYMYTEASSPRLPGDKARFMSADIPSSPIKCVDFWFHMYGSNIDSLNLYVQTGGTLGSAQWSRQGTRSNSWIYGQYELVSTSTSKVGTIVFEGVIGSSYNGDIALDDIRIYEGSCPGKL